MKMTGWGLYPQVQCTCHMPETEAEVMSLLQKDATFIARGMGRSYGDSSLNEQLLFSRRMDKMINFSENGLVTCQSGVLLSELIEVFLPRGWFLPVTPGTKFITVGGAIASDIHGKNHHKVGCFSEFVSYLKLMLPSGDIIRCSKEENIEMFHATCGGMGLTGIIIEAAIQLQPVKSSSIDETIIRCNNLEEVFRSFEEHEDVTYSVAWIDCLAKNESLGRSILMLGEHAITGDLTLPPLKPSISIPCKLPDFVLNKYSVGLFNELFYRKNKKINTKVSTLESFFYPLDAIGHWNNLYGRRGFTQYQLALPKKDSFEGFKTILGEVSAAGLGSFLSILKLFGPENENYLSFPMEGYTLTIDVKIQPGLFNFLHELDQIVVDYGGRLYLTKDVCMSGSVFKKGYPQYNNFLKIRRKFGLKNKFQSLQSRRLGI